MIPLRQFDDLARQLTGPDVITAPASGVPWRSIARVERAAESERPALTAHA
jgi:hypothetical protein